MRGKQAVSPPDDKASRPSVYNNLAIMLLVVLTALAMFTLLTSKQASDSSVSSVVTVTGSLVCLPHKSDSLFSVECVVGLRGDDGRYYELKYVTGDLTSEGFGARVRVKGTLSAPPVDTIYNVDGILSVDSATKQ